MSTACPSPLLSNKNPTPVSVRQERRERRAPTPGLLLPSQVVGVKAQPFTRFETITPALAQQYLDRAAPSRKIKPYKVDLYARRMKAGKWDKTHQGVAFDTDGLFFDGRHRMHAIIKAGISVEMQVSYNITKRAAGVVDTGATRTPADAMTIAGLDWATPSAVSLAYAMIDGPEASSSWTLERDELHEFMTRHEAALTFAEGAVKRRVKVLTVASVRAVYARAFYSLDGLAIRRFADTMASGIPETRDECAVTPLALGKRLRALAGVKGRQARADIYRMTQQSLRWYADGRSVNYSRANADDLFPLPK